MSNSINLYRVFADEKGFFGEEGLGWGDRSPEGEIHFDVLRAADGRLQANVIAVKGVFSKPLDILAAQKVLLSWI